eukprot:CAMPEP_0202695156 /NCGR_PEP_ID=MMETSP1385-20130828/8825_1 /ASSEMBLY_ACC=CAM_ASM_000861 /TAXON_ID=933848 /ORGANISM="Elphidium margaritaceum" /LENGTH=172 /DNA_ID=CAMNT_0049351131 /DNA_START=30 /DNA_END=548 /DNA_ORIENTATION=+
MSLTKIPKTKSRKLKKKSNVANNTNSNVNKQKLSQLLNPTSSSSCNPHHSVSNAASSVDAAASVAGTSSEQPSCMRGDGFDIETFLSGLTHDNDKLSSQMLPTRAAAIKARNGMSNSSFGAYGLNHDKDPRAVVNDHRLFYEEYMEPFKCIQLFNQANLEVLAYKLQQNCPK